MGEPASGPRTVREEVAELLGVDAQTLAPDADLLAEGLDSLRIMTLSGRWRKRGIDVDFAALVANPTVRAWGTLIEGRPAAPDAPAPEPAAPDGAASHDHDGQPFALAPMQHAMWVGRNDDQQLGGVAGHLYVEFDGAGVSVPRLREAAAALSARHPMLRVEFLPDGTQRIGTRVLDVAVEDLRGLDDDAAEAALLRTRETRSHQLLDGEVLQLALSLLPGGRTRLHVDLDMQAADAVSYRTLMGDLARLYRGATLPELTYTYRRYRAAVEESPRYAPRPADVSWWRERLSELPGPPALPTVPPAEQPDPRRSTRHWHWLDPATRDAVFAAAHRRSITPAMAVAASFAGVLARWSGTPRFLLNLPLFAREPLHPDVEHLVGDFSSSLLLDVDLHDAPTPAHRARAVQDSLHTTAAHASYPGLSVLRDLGRDRGRQVLAPVVFTSALGLGELFDADVTEHFGTPVWILSQGPQVLLDAQVTEFDGGVLINWDVRADAFRPGVVEAMFAHHIAELRRLADDAAWEAAEPAPVPEAQRAVREALNFRTAPPSGEALHDGFFRTAERQPDAPAVFSSLGDLTYAQLREQVLAVCATLRRTGVRPGDTVAVLGPKTAEQIPALLGIHAAGAAYLPVGIDQPPDRARRILESAGVRAALVCGTELGELAVPAVTVAEAIRSGRPDAARTRACVTDPGELAYVLFTSGSTGEPKGVELSHDAAMNTVEFINGHFGIGADDRCLALSTLECDLSVLDIFGMLRAGGAIVVVDEAQRRDPDAWARLIAEHAVTVLHFMPGWLEMLAEVGAGRLDSVRVIPTGGDWVRTELVRALRELAPRARIAGLGGATETATHNTICEPGELPEHWTAIPFGIPLPNNACRVVADWASDGGSDCPDWVPGELWVTGRGIARGYRGRPDLTAERFVTHAGRTWYRTGDLVRYRPDGAIEFVGRADHRVKISGYRVELGEVEGALSRVPGVAHAVVAVLPGPAGRDALLAALVRLDDPRITTAQIASALTDLVPPHMVPQHLGIAETIPFTPGGKIDRRAVVELLTASLAAAGEAAGACRAPSTPLETALARILGDLLNRGAVGVGADEDFFALGGDSVLATAAVARIREWLDAPSVTVTDIFAARTVSALARLLTEQESGDERLSAVAELYLEIAHMDNADVAAELDAPRIR